MYISKIITLNNGQVVELRLSEDWEEITFYQNNVKIKDCEFEFYDLYEDQTVYLLKRMYSPSHIKRQGLGEEVLRFFKDETDAIIVTRKFDGIVQSDGSHLTENAPNFVKKMKNLKLIDGDC